MAVFKPCLCAVFVDLKLSSSTFESITFPNLHLFIALMDEYHANGNQVLVKFDEMHLFFSRNGLSDCERAPLVFTNYK